MTGDSRTILTTIYCSQCEHTLVAAASGNDDLIEAAERGDPEAAARLAQARADILATHQMECAA
jgi:hypothetical protein